MEEEINILYPYFFECFSGPFVNIHQELEKRLERKGFQISHFDSLFPGIVRRFDEEMRPLINYLTSGILNSKYLTKNFDIIQTGPSLFHIPWAFLKDSIQVHFCGGTVPSHKPEKIRYEYPLKWLIENADHRISVSNYVAEVVEEHLGLESTVIHNGVDTSEFRPENKTSEVLEKYDLEKPIVLFVGRLIEGKRPDIVIKLAEYFPEVSFVIRGDGPLEKKLKEYRYSRDVSKVIFLPNIPFDDLKSLYASSDVFLFPSEYEPFGLVTVEAMASGLPVIAHDSGGSSEIVTKETGLLSKNNSVGELKECLSILLEDKSLREDIGEKGRKRVKKKFDWDKISGEYADYYQKITNRKSIG